MRDKHPTGKSLKKNILLAVENLPPMPQIMHKARELMESDDASFKDIANLVELDPSIAMKILKLSELPEVTAAMNTE